MTMPKKNDPLTVEEMTTAGTHFAELFAVVQQQHPNASVEDALRIMESVAKYAHSLRAKEREEKVKEKFGFNKTTEGEASED